MKQIFYKNETRILVVGMIVGVALGYLELIFWLGIYNLMFG